MTQPSLYQSYARMQKRANASDAPIYAKTPGDNPVLDNSIESAVDGRPASGYTNLGDTNLGDTNLGYTASGQPNNNVTTNGSEFDFSSLLERYGPAALVGGAGGGLFGLLTGGGARGALLGSLLGAGGLGLLQHYLGTPVTEAPKNPPR